MATNFIFNNGGTMTDFSDAFIPRDAFSSGGLYAWGNNGNGQLGDNTVVSKSSPVQTIASGVNWKQVSTSQRNQSVCLGLKTDGTLWAWGDNGVGGLGDGTTTSKSSPVQTISGGSNWKQVTAGDRTSAGIKTDGTLWMWGFNYKGSAGTNNSGTFNITSPVQTIAGGTNWKQVAGGYNISAAIKTDGTLWMWGANEVGQLGDNTTVNKSSPVQTISGGTNWKQVTAGRINTGAIKTDGTLWTWGGFSGFSQLGYTSAVNRSSPTQVAGTTWKQVSFGVDAAAAIKTDGTLWTWGRNSAGALASNDRTDRDTPNQTVSGGTNWKHVASGYRAMGAIKTDGTLWMWGRNYGGTLGANSLNSVSSPIQTVAGGTNWKQVSTGGFGFTVAITDIF